MGTRICTVCGKPFELKYNGSGKQVYCSHECRSKREAEYRKELAKERRICEKCGKEFKPATRKQTKCTACQREENPLTPPPPRKRFGVPKECRTCIYYGKMSNIGICQYILMMDEPRGIPIEDCISGAEGSRYIKIPPRKRGPKPKEGV